MGHVGHLPFYVAKHDPFHHKGHHVPPLSRTFEPSSVRSQISPTRFASSHVPCSINVQGLIVGIQGVVINGVGKKSSSSSSPYAVHSPYASMKHKSYLHEDSSSECPPSSSMPLMCSILVLPANQVPPRSWSHL